MRVLAGRRRIIGIIFAALLLLGLLGSCALLIYAIETENIHPEVPTESAPGKIILASRGCCFTATEVTVYFLDSQGNKIPFITEENVHFEDIFEYFEIPYIDTPVTLMIDFRSDWDNNEMISLSAGEFSDTKSMLETGILFYFDEGALIVRTGTEAKAFSAVTDHGKWSPVEINS